MFSSVLFHSFFQSPLQKWLKVAFLPCLSWCYCYLTDVTFSVNWHFLVAEVQYHTCLRTPISVQRSSIHLSPKARQVCCLPSLFHLVLTVKSLLSSWVSKVFRCMQTGHLISLCERWQQFHCFHLPLSSVLSVLCWNGFLFVSVGKEDTEVR